jgi:hypothetical protein
MLRENEMDADQQKFFETKTKEATESKPWLIPFREKLLAIGGSGVVLWNGSNEKAFVELLLQYGHVYPAKKSGVRKGDANRCHENAQRWARQRPDWYNYATGYALSRQIWRPHSWLFNLKRKRIIETTVRQEKYFGFDYPIDVGNGESV